MNSLHKMSESGMHNAVGNTCCRIHVKQQNSQTDLMALLSVELRVEGKG